MFGRIATLVGYQKAPKATFVLRHPVKGTAALLAAKNVSRNTALGVGAATVAVPLGIWFFSRRNHEHTA